MKLNSDKVMSISALVVSLMTVIVLVMQTNMIQEHQRASVFPYLMVGNEGKNTGNYKYILSNNGIGPAIIESVEIVYQDSTYAMDLPVFLYTYQTGMDTLQNLLHSNIWEGMLIPAEQKIKILEVDGNEATAKIIYQMLTAARLEMRIIYRSMYDEKWLISTSNGAPQKIE